METIVEIKWCKRRVYGVERWYFSTKKRQELWSRITGRASLTQRDMDAVSELFGVSWVEVDQYSLEPLPNRD